MQPFDRIINDLITFNTNAESYVAEEIVQNKEAIIDQSTERVYNEGRDVDNKLLTHKYTDYKVYSYNYTQLKRRLGLYQGHIDLHLSGEYLKSFTLTVKNGVVEIKGNKMVKGFDLASHLVRVYGRYEGLSSDEWREIVNLYIMPRLIFEYEKAW